MSGILIFGAKPISLSKCGKAPPVTLKQAARHNKREIQAELGADGNIDPARTRLNESLTGPATAGEVDDLAKSKMLAAGVDVAGLCKDYTQAVELMFSLPMDFPGDDGEVFRSCVQWVAQRFGAGCILSADVHRDELAPHCHVLMLPPIDGGTMRGSDAVALARSAQTRQSLGREVARKFGLTMGVGKLAGKRKHEAANLVLERMRAIESAVDPALYAVFMDAVRRDPGPFMDKLGIDAPARELKSFTAIMTSPGKGPRKECDTQSPIGFAAGAGGRMPRHAGDRESPLGFAGRVPAAGAGGESPLGFGGAGDLEKTEVKTAKPNLCIGFDAKPAHPDGPHDHDYGKGRRHDNDRAVAADDQDQAEALHRDARGKGAPLVVADGRPGGDPCDDQVQAVADSSDHDDPPGDWVRVRDGDEGFVDGFHDDLAGRPDGGCSSDVVRDREGCGPPQPSDGDRMRVVWSASQRAGSIRVKTGAGDSGDGVQRVRDNDMGPGYWDSETGEFMRCSGPQAGGRGGALPWS